MNTSQTYKTPFDFGAALVQPFITSGGAAFGKRLWFWTTIPLAISLILAMPLLAPHYGELMIWYQEYMQLALSGGQPDAELMGRVMQVMGKMLPGFLVVTLGMWLSAVMGEAALHRKVLRDEEYSGRPIRLGGDELRVMAAQLGVWGFLFLVYFVGIFASVIVMGLLGAILGPLGFAFGAFSILAVICFLIMFAVRLMPAAALTVRDQNVRVLGARKITKGRFWPLFGAFIVLYIGGYIAVSLVQTVGTFIVFGNLGPASQIMEEGADLAQIMEDAGQRIKNPAVMFGGLIAILAYSAVTSIWYLCLSGIGTYAASWAQDKSDMNTTFE